MSRWSRPLTVQCAVYAAFAMPVGMMGPGWPSVRGAFDQPAEALGVLALGYGVGRLVSSTSAGLILARVPVGRATAALCVTLAAAEVLVGVTRSFPVLVVAVSLVGLWTGCLDSLGARFQTVIRDVGSAGLMFGSYGVGATLAPALVALTSWTVGFGLAAAAALGAAVAAGRAAVAWPDGLDAPAPSRRTAGGAVRLAPLAVTLVAFAAFCGIEVVTAGWSATYLIDDRRASARVTGFALSGFWAGVTVGRLLLGRSPLSPGTSLLATGTAVTVLVLALPVLPLPLALASLALLGLTLAGIFPTLMSTTAERVGGSAAPRVSGWQLLTANVSGTGLSVLVGVLVAAVGPSAPVWVLVGAAVVGLPALVVTRRLGPAEAAPAETVRSG